MTTTIVIDGVSLVLVCVAGSASLLANLFLTVAFFRLRGRIATLQGVIEGLRDGLRAAAPDEKVSDGRQ